MTTLTLREYLRECLRNLTPTQLERLRERRRRMTPEQLERQRELDRDIQRDMEKPNVKTKN